MPIATITMIYCVKEATGADIGAIQAIADLPAQILPGEIGGLAVRDAINTLPGVIAAIDLARSDPDDLYITTSTVGDIENSIWPEPGGDGTLDMLGGQSVAPGEGGTLPIAIEFARSVNISLWDYDTVSGDDLLGSVTMLATEQGQGEIAKLAKSDVEGSRYYIFYTVDG